jgi:hypothetical protein
MKIREFREEDVGEIKRLYVANLEELKGYKSVAKTTKRALGEFDDMSRSFIWADKDGATVRAFWIAEDDDGRVRVCACGRMRSSYL